MLGTTRGFTLIELMIVIAIIGILAAAAIPSITGAICDANGSSAEAAISSFKTAYAQCRADGEGPACDTVDGATYNEYLGSDAIDNLSVSVVNGDISTISHNAVGCDYEAANGGTGGADVSSNIMYNATTGNIQNF